MENDGKKTVGVSCMGCVPWCFGICAAICISWIFNHSVLWCILHGILSWFYVMYKAVWYVITNY
jgi:hypothetical protein